MAADSGVRDGKFVRFSGWDVPGYNQAHFPKLDGNVDALKKIVLEKQGDAFYAFNSKGWIKSWGWLDYREFRPGADSDLYVRVEYPGWYFAQGLDSTGNDIVQIGDASTATGLKETVTKWYGTDNNIAAFNTEGWIKRKVTYPLTAFPGYAGALDGIYIRLKFKDYTFFQGVDSNNNDIKETPEAKDDVPELIRIANTLPNGAGFNTSGWHKSVIKRPLTVKPPEFVNSWQGTFVRHGWPDFVFLPGLDAPGNDIRRLQGKRLYELIQACRDDRTAVAINTNGWLKRDIADQPVDFPTADNLNGVYLKIPTDLTKGSESASQEAPEDLARRLLNAIFFALRGTVILWSRWVTNDLAARAQYQRASGTQVDEIRKDVREGRLHILEAMRLTIAYCKTYMLEGREINSPVGMLLARGIKLTGSQFPSALDEYAVALPEGKRFKDLGSDDKNTVFRQIVDAAGRDVNKISDSLRSGNLVSRGVTVIGVSVSLYSVATAPEWEKDLGRQVTAWSESITGGKLGIGVGPLVSGPIGAILGGIAGSILGSIGADALAKWFFGGSSSSSAVQLLDQALNPTSELVAKKLATSGKGYYTHHVRAAHRSVYSRNATGAGSVIEKMVNDVPSETSTTKSTLDTEANSEILATIVWVSSSGKTLPSNGANAADLWKLLDYVVRNLPT